MTSLSLSGLSDNVAGTLYTPVVQALDANANPVAAYAGSVTFTTSDSAAQIPAAYTFQAADGGAHTFASAAMFRTATSQYLRVRDSNGLTSQQNVNVSPGNANTFSVSGFAANSNAGQGYPVVVTALDIYGNIATSYVGSPTISSTDAQSTSVSCPFTAADQGVHTCPSLHLLTPGNQNVTATDGALAGA